MREFEHVVRFDLTHRKIVIERLFQDGQRVLYTEVDVPQGGAEDAAFQTLGRKLGENLIIDSPAGRALFGI